MSCDHHIDDRCTLGLFGGAPSPGCCAICPRYEGPIRGAGDVVHVTLSVLGIARAMEFVFTEDCGSCGQRRAALNAMMCRTTKKDGD